MDLNGPGTENASTSWRDTPTGSSDGDHQAATLPPSPAYGALTYVQ